MRHGEEPRFSNVDEALEMLYDSEDVEKLI